MTKYTGMIVWTGEGTLLDTAGPHHTLTIQKKYIYDKNTEIQKQIHSWSCCSQGDGDNGTNNWFS